MMKKISQTVPDVVIGKLFRGKKKDQTPAKYFALSLYSVDSKGQVEQAGTWKGDNGKEYPNYKLSAILRIPESTLLEVATGKRKSCNVYWSPK